MKKLLIAVILIAFVVPVASAKNPEPIDLPGWATPECILTIATIIQHESGSMKSSQVFHFMAGQIIADAKRMGCNNLTQWRWKILSFPKPSKMVFNAVYDWPTGIPKCRFVGYPGDVPVWRSYGYRASVDFTFKVKGMTVVGADCD